LTLPIAIILAAGQGLRLAPLTRDRPKALVEIHGRTLLERSVEALAAAGFRRATVVTGTSSSSRCSGTDGRST